MHKSMKIDRLGEVNTNKYGSKMKIIEYPICYDILVEFENGYKMRSTYDNFSRGNISNPYDKSVCKVGFLGEGKYQTTINNKITPQYILWSNMLERCFGKKHRSKNPSYIDCVVCEEWHNFQNFAKWYDDNYYTIDGERIHLDKDILIKGNKIYCPEKCIFVPERINTLFTNCNVSRGQYPIGVNLYKNTGQYIAKISKNKKRIHLGLFNTPEEAFNTYKEAKEEHIKQIAEEYKNKIPNKLYNALYQYKIEITD